MASLGGSAIAAVIIFAWNVVKLPAIMDAESAQELAVLAERLASEQLRKEQVETLGRFLSRGTELMAQCGNHDQVPPEDAANEWLGELVEYLNTNLGSAYSARLNDCASAPVGYSNGTWPDHNALYHGIRTRLYHLQEFLKEMGRQLK